MKHENRFALVTITAFGLSVLAPACPPAPLPPTPDAADASPSPAASDASLTPQRDAGSSVAARVCANLSAQGCAEGLAANCIAVVQHAIDTNLTPVNARCLEGAAGKQGVRLCGFVRCP